MTPESIAGTVLGAIFLMMGIAVVIIIFGLLVAGLIIAWKATKCLVQSALDEFDD